jgi:putative ABC transport system substrate-binding protein
MGWDQTDPRVQAGFTAFRQRLAELGWSEGSNVHIEVRWTDADVNRTAFLAKELVGLRPNAMLVGTTPATAAVQREAKDIPIVFVHVADPVGSGFVESLAHPAGNITGFVNLEATVVEKWAELLKEIAPRTMRAAMMFNPQTAPYAEYYLKPLQAASSDLGVTVVVMPIQTEGDIESAIANIASEPNTGLILMNDSFMFVHRRAILELTARHRIPTVGFAKELTAEGGLISYSTDVPDLFVRASVYVDRILRGAKPADLPVQAPTKFELVVNLKTAKELDLMVPATLLARADEVIE